MRQGFEITRYEEGKYPLGAVATGKGVHFSVAKDCGECALLLYRKGAKTPVTRLVFPQTLRMGDVWRMEVAGNLKGLSYTYEADGEEFADPYGEVFFGHEHWGLEENASVVARAAIDAEETFDWNGDQRPNLSYEESIFYQIHVRGLTKHASSGVEPKLRGTFRAVQEKIAYFQELGVTTLKMQPPFEFQEVTEYGKLNYWGYRSGLRMAPKASYASEKDAAREFQELVRALHQAKMELVVELYFDGRESVDYVLQVARMWAGRFHVDGIHLVGYAPVDALASDPYLSQVKILADHVCDARTGKVRRMAECTDSFQLAMRGFLKGDGGMLSYASEMIRRNPAGHGVLNFMANAGGFTLMDMVSYNEKHNEDNGEENQDGTDYNQSWNCGVEGATRKKKIVALRKKQLKNAILMLFLSQGTPMLLAGDEFGQSKRGNNNSYCQDNEISWVNWKLMESNEELFHFVKAAIAFRKNHSVFHMEKEPAMMDWRSCGLPDLSFHGTKAWFADFDASGHMLGVLYCGEYGKRADGTPDDYFYVGYNMHWIPQELALPTLPAGKKWHLVLDTAEEHAIFAPEGEEKLLLDQKHYTANERSVVIAVGR